MKHLKLLLLFVAGSLLAHAATLPCVLAALSSYDASGFACTEDSGALTFSNFTFSETGSASVPDSAIDLTPVGDGFDIQAAFSAPAGASLDVLLSYEVSDPAGLVSDSLAIAGFGQSGTGAVEIAETICLGADFVMGVCPTGKVDSLNVFDNAGGDVASQSVSFTPPLPNAVGIVKDITIQGGSGLSSAQVSLVDNLTTGNLLSVVTPEPSTALVIGGVLLALSTMRRSYWR